MRLMILEERRLRQTVQAATGAVSIGSNPSCAVHLPDTRICAHQATLSQDEEGAWWLEVVDPSVPTCVNRSVQKGRAKLRHLDEIEMGVFCIRLFLDSGKTREEIQRERMVTLARQHGENLPLGTIIRPFASDVAVSKEQLVEMTLLSIRLAQMDSIRDALSPTVRALLRTFQARRAWMGVRGKDRGDFEWTFGMSQDGQPCDRPSFSQIMQPRCLTHSQFLCSPEAPSAGIKSAMAVPLVCQSGTLGMLYVENDQGDEPYSAGSLNVLSAMACCVAMPVENVLRKATAKRQAVTSTEQTIVRATQDAITPKILPQWKDWQIAAYRQMGTARCCDLYDIVQLPDKSLGLLVARLMVGGMAAPRYFAEVWAAFRSAALHGDGPHLFVRSLNWLIGADPQNSVDLATARIAPADGRVTYCRAGDGVHIGKIRADGAFEPCAPSGQPPIGRVRTAAYEPQTLVLSSGESLAITTDGISATKNAQGATMGAAGLFENLCDAVGSPPGQALAEFSADLTEFIAGGACPDDITVLMVRRA